MNLKEMADESAKSWVFDRDSKYEGLDQEMLYVTLAIGCEAGELQNLVKKIIRRRNHTDGHSNDDLEKDVPHEMVDVLYYVFRMADLLEIDLEKAFVEKMEINKARYNK